MGSHSSTQQAIITMARTRVLTARGSSFSGLNRQSATRKIPSKRGRSNGGIDLFFLSFGWSEITSLLAIRSAFAQAGADVDRFDSNRESHSEVDVCFGEMNVEPFSEQSGTNHDQK